jgi:aspartyl-tRNA(Asn)/glutamyl-tRNA(Gln) amidotransferase subunit C
MISREEIEHLATLARIELKEGEVESLQKDITDILAYVGQVESVVGGAAEPVLPLHHNVMRTDTPRASEDQLAGKEAAVRAAFPKQENGYNVVRKIIQKEDL